MVFCGLVSESKLHCQFPTLHPPGFTKREVVPPLLVHTYQNCRSHLIKHTYVNHLLGTGRREELDRVGVVGWVMNSIYERKRNIKNSIGMEQ